jgi:endoglycosylceramidase
MPHIISLVICCLFALEFISCQLPRIRVDPNSQHFVDEYGRVRIFHGVNVVYKLPPFLPNLTHFDPQNSLTDDDLANLQKWGFNVIRFYTAWIGVNPKSENEVDQNYLSQLSTAVQMMENKGIYGEGVPDWVAQKLGEDTLKSFPFPLSTNMSRESDTGYPKLDDCFKNPFFHYYLTEAVMQSFHML